MDPRQAAAQLAACAWLKQQISKIEASAKPHLELKAGESKNAEVPFRDETATIAKVIMAQGRKSVEVEDWKALAKWVEERWPTKVDWHVDPVWWKEQSSKISKDGAFYDDQGEICPYVIVLQADPYSMTKLDKDVADEVMTALLRSGGINVQLWDGEPQLSIESKTEGTQDK